MRNSVNFRTNKVNILSRNTKEDNRCFTDLNIDFILKSSSKHSGTIVRDLNGHIIQYILSDGQ